MNSACFQMVFAASAHGGRPLKQNPCMSSGDDNGNHGPVGRSAYWLSWMLGAAILVAVVVCGPSRL